MKTLHLFFVLLLFNGALAQRVNERIKVDSIIQSYNKPYAPGFSIGIIEDGKQIYFEGVGYANVEARTPNSSSTIFGIASIAKQFTAACIWSLVKENKISLEDDIRKYLPEFPSYGTPILVRHMLNHTSGIRNYHALMELSGFDYDTEFHDNQTILELARKQKELNNIPGEKVVYGNTSYTLLACIIERITGQNLNEYAKNAIFIPLGMHHTFYRIDTLSSIPNRALGYVPNETNGFTSLSSNQITYGAGGIGSSIEDLAIWSNVLAGLNSEYLELTKFLTTVEKLPSGEYAKYARGVMVDAYKNKKTIHHSGYGLGGQSQIIVLPEIKLAVIILTNDESIDPTPISYKILDVFLPKQTVGVEYSKEVVTLNKKEVQKFAGNYIEQNSDMKMEFFMEHDTLKVLGSYGKNPLSLIPIGKNEFIRSNNASVHYVFTSNDKKSADLVVYFGGTPFYFSKTKFLDFDSMLLTDYVGSFYSEELSVTYTFSIEENVLFVNYPKHTNIKLKPCERDAFGNGQRIRFQFLRNSNNEVVKLNLSAEGTVKNIEFIKK